MKRSLTSLLIIMTALSGLAGCSWNQEREQPVVVTTLFPQYTMAEMLAGDLIDLQMVLPFGSSAHSFEPQPSVLITILDADLLLYTSPLLETWIDDLVTSQTSAHVKAVDLSVGITLEEGHHDHEEEEHEEEELEEALDPHYWMDPFNAKIMAQTIAAELKNLLPDDHTTIDANLVTLMARIDQWHSDNLELVEHAQITTIIHGGHNAFGYFTHRYGINYLTPYEGFSTDSQPTPNALVTLMNTMQALGVTVVYTEEIVSPAVAQTIAQQTGATIERLSTGGTLSQQDFTAGVTFFDIMDTNIEKLKVGLRYEPNPTN